MLTLQKYSVSIDEKVIIGDLSLEFHTGKTHILLGKNGSGKSSLVFSLMGHPKYVTSGTVLLGDHDISDFSPDQRSHQGLFLSFQNIPEIPGITLFEYLRTIYNIHQKHLDSTKKPVTSILFRRIVSKIISELDLDSSFLDRDLYVGFSGGEKRRVEMLQIRLLAPSVILLDEIDSGLDVGAIRILAREIDRLHDQGKTILLVTHNFSLLEMIHIDEVIFLEDGVVAQRGGREVIDFVLQSGFE